MEKHLRAALTYKTSGQFSVLCLLRILNCLLQLGIENVNNLIMELILLLSAVKITELKRVSGQLSGQPPPEIRAPPH